MIENHVFDRSVGFLTERLFFSFEGSHIAPHAMIKTLDIFLGYRKGFFTHCQTKWIHVVDKKKIMW